MRKLASRDLNSGLLGSVAQTFSYFSEYYRVCKLDGYVVDHRNWGGADADQIVDTHRHAVDSDLAVAVRLLGDDQLGADSIGTKGDPEIWRNLKDACVVAWQRNHAGSIDRSGA